MNVKDKVKNLCRNAKYNLESFLEKPYRNGGILLGGGCVDLAVNHCVDYAKNHAVEIPFDCLGPIEELAEFLSTLVVKASSTQFIGTTPIEMNYIVGLSIFSVGFTLVGANALYDGLQIGYKGLRKGLKWLNKSLFGEERPPYI